MCTEEVADLDALILLSERNVDGEVAVDETHLVEETLWRERGARASKKGGTRRRRRFTCRGFLRFLSLGLLARWQTQVDPRCNACGAPQVSHPPATCVRFPSARQDQAVFDQAEVPLSHTDESSFAHSLSLSGLDKWRVLDGEETHNGDADHGVDDVAFARADRRVRLARGEPSLDLDLLFGLVDKRNVHGNVLEVANDGAALALEGHLARLDRHLHALEDIDDLRLLQVLHGGLEGTHRVRVRGCPALRRRGSGCGGGSGLKAMQS